MTRLLHRLLGRLPVGWLQLAHSPSRLATAISGVAFANVLVFVQLGLANALSSTITQGYALFSADILVSASDGHTLSDGSHVARAHLWQAMADRDVVGGAELYVGTVLRNCHVVQLLSYHYKEIYRESEEEILDTFYLKLTDFL